MYELQLVNNGFLAEYNEDNKVFVESILYIKILVSEQ